MKVAFATSSLSGSFLSAFPDAQVLGDAENYTPDIDLLIFTGGEDVSPKRYGASVMGAYGINEQRDEVEFSIFERAVKNPRTRILGVCRGLQLINVGLGGSLVQDMGSEGRSHTSIHPITHLTKNIFSDLLTVNSLHHQCIERIGNANVLTDSGGVIKLRAAPIAIHPDTNTIEMAMWGETIMATQFHPEFFGEEYYTEFFDKIKKWVLGELTIMNKPEFELPRYSFNIENAELRIGNSLREVELTFPSSIVDEEVENEEEEEEEDEDWDSDEERDEESENEEES